MRVDLPSAARSPISLIGMAIATVMAVVFVALLGLEFFGVLRNPYLGLLLFIAVPVVFLCGLLLIPLGIWHRRRRLAAGHAPDTWPVIDLGRARTRAIVAIVTMLTIVNLLIVSLAGYGAVHHMESAEFCGATCHTTMEPEYAAYQVSAHARVPCVSCHVGSGAEALVQSKINGTRQLWQLATNNVPTPVPVPVRNLRPARETCETCHWPEKMHGERLRHIREYGNDEKNSETVTAVQLHVGGGSAERGSGIHWHMNIANRIEYIATDPQRQVIPWVKMTARDGVVTEFTVAGTTAAQLAQGEHRVMDCLDCHNRPAHTFEPSVERAVDNGIARGLIGRELPFVRREAVSALSTAYDSKDRAMRGIDAQLRAAYRGQPDGTVRSAIAGTQALYSQNVFPAMKVGWGTYPNNLGHVAFPGCFRCHDESHIASNGAVIAQDCATCHDLP